LSEKSTMLAGQESKQLQLKRALERRGWSVVDYPAKVSTGAESEAWLVESRWSRRGAQLHLRWANVGDATVGLSWYVKVLETGANIYLHHWDDELPDFIKRLDVVRTTTKPAVSEV
jgi:hypothetical protein